MARGWPGHAHPHNVGHMASVACTVLTMHSIVSMVLLTLLVTSDVETIAESLSTDAGSVVHPDNNSIVSSSHIQVFRVF